MDRNNSSVPVDMLVGLLDPRNNLFSDSCPVSDSTKPFPSRPVKRMQSATKPRSKIRGKALTSEQYLVLKMCLAVEQYPSRRQRQSISEFMAIPPDRVKVWFQNARSRYNPAATAASCPPEYKGKTAFQIMNGEDNARPSPAPSHPGTPTTASTPEPETPTMVSVGVQCDLFPRPLSEMYMSGALNRLIAPTDMRASAHTLKQKMGGLTRQLL